METEEPTRLAQNVGRCGSELRGLNHDLSLKMIKFKAKVTKFVTVNASKERSQNL